MVVAQTEGWKLLALRGTIAALFGAFALVRPATTATAVVVLIGAFVLVDGVLGTVTAFRTGGSPGQTTLGIAEGVLGLVVGLIAVIAPHAALRFLSVLIGLWALVTGALEIAAAIGSRPVNAAGAVHAGGRVNWLLGAAGALSLILGGILVFSPGAGVVLITVLIGVYALGFGIALIALALRLRRARAGIAR